MMHNFIANVREEGDLLKSFEQRNLVCVLSRTNWKRGISPACSRANCEYELLLLSCLPNYCLLLFVQNISPILVG